MATILVVSLSDFGTDPRVDRQIDFLRGDHHVIAAGFGPPIYDDVDFVELDVAKLPRYPRFLLELGIAHGERLLGLNKRAYWADRSLRHWRPLLSWIRKDLTIVNDLIVLPLAFSIDDEAPVVFDAHEHAPSEYVSSRAWRLLRRRHVRWICRTFLTRVAGMMAVSPGIGALYQREFGTPSVVVTNAARFHDLEPSQVHEPVRLVHFGIADPQRRLGDTLDAVKMLGAGYTLDLLLMAEGRLQEHLSDLRRSVAGEPRIRFLDPVPMRELVPFANSYDVGLFMLPSATPQAEFTLPNKFFEYIQAGIVPAIGPSPDMARIVREWDCGIVAEEYTPEALAAAIASVASERLAELKRNAHRAARQLCAERNRELVIDVVDRALRSGRGTAAVPAARRGGA
jgi:glycosyltransferase involved in cell wall biosynthesis